MKTILITGGAGFIGSHFIDLVVREGIGRVVCLDAFTYAADVRYLDGVKDRIEIVRGDIRMPEDLALIFERGVDWVVNFAAETHVDTSIDAPIVFAETNVIGTLRLLMFSLKYGVERFLQISTDEVYGSTTGRGFGEEDPHNPSSPYSASKSGAEQMCNAFKVTYGLPVLIARGTNNYGPRQNREKFIPTCIRCALRGEPIPVYGTGTNQRDWIYVGDNVEALALILAKAEPGGVFNVGANSHVTNLELARRILRLCGKSEDMLEFVEDRKGHDFRYAVDTTRVAALGWQATTDFDSGLKRTIEWYMDRQTEC